MLSHIRKVRPFKTIAQLQVGVKVQSLATVACNYVRTTTLSEKHMVVIDQGSKSLSMRY